MTTTRLPERYQIASKALADMVRIDEVKQIRDKAIAMQEYARRSNDHDLVDNAVEVRAQATLRLNELIAEAKASGRLATGTRGQLAGKKAGTSAGKGKGTGKTKAKTKAASGGVAETPPEGIVKLSDYKIDKNLLKEMHKLGKMTKKEFDAEVKKRQRLAWAAAGGDKAAVKEAHAARQKEKKAVRVVREKKLAAKIMALPDAKYGVVVADPGWKFKPQSEETGMDRSADNHYTCEDLDAIKAQKVASIAAKDCVLFLWVTVPFAKAGIEVMEAWGFKYVSQYVWVKDKAGTGYWNRNRHEILLVGVQGKPVAPAPGTQWDSVIEAPIGKHSAKPEQVLKMIEEYYPTVPKIELNRRGAARPGWEAHGNEAQPAGEASELNGKKAKGKKKAAGEAPAKTARRKKPAAEQPAEPTAEPAVEAVAEQSAEPIDQAAPMAQPEAGDDHGVAAE